MYKVHTTLNVDNELLESAKKKLFNISEILENAIREKLEEKQVSIKNSDKCEFCGREDVKATRDNLNGLTWLWPDERWICSNCLTRKSVNEVSIY